MLANMVEVMVRLRGLTTILRDNWLIFFTFTKQFRVRYGIRLFHLGIRSDINNPLLNNLKLEILRNNFANPSPRLLLPQRIGILNHCLQIVGDAITSFSRAYLRQVLGQQGHHGTSSERFPLIIFIAYFQAALSSDTAFILWILITHFN